MAKLIVSVVSFILGCVITAVAAYALWSREYPATTEVWRTSHEVTSESGVVIPRGVDLIQERWMSEGFVTLKLYVKVEGATLEHFDRRTEAQRNLVIPTWVE